MNTWKSIAGILLLGAVSVWFGFSAGKATAYKEIGRAFLSHKTVAVECTYNHKDWIACPGDIHTDTGRELLVWQGYDPQVPMILRLKQ